MGVFFYLLSLAGLNVAIALAPWGSVYLSLIIAITYFAFRPDRVLHPNNMVFAFYGLYVVMSSTLNLVLHLIDWEYVLPGGQQIYWNEISRYVLFQAEFTFLVLFFSFHFFSRDKPSPAARDALKVTVSSHLTALVYAGTVVLIIYFIEVTGGLAAWIDDYSFTYLTKREGHGFLNIVLLAFGNIIVFLLGLRFFLGRDRGRTVLLALPMIAALAYVSGVKGRVIFLLLMFLSPYFMTTKFRLRYVLGFGVSFFVLLYVGTLVRTAGFYATPPFFLEMLVGYFNSFQLHEYIVGSREPALLTTVFQIFTKPMQVLGLAGPDADFDISVMLTKEFFPAQWADEHATQQWPLDTELYLNYYGFYLSWIPLLGYALFVSWLYRAAVLRYRFVLLPIFLMEFQRIFSTLRGTIVPWEVFFYIGQYLLIYVVCRTVITPNGRNIQLNAHRARNPAVAPVAG